MHYTVVQRSSWCKPGERNGRAEAADARPGRRSAPDEDLREEDLARRVARGPDPGQLVGSVDVLQVCPALEPPAHRLGRGVAKAPVGGDVLGGPPAGHDP